MADSGAHVVIRYFPDVFSAEYTLFASSKRTVADILEDIGLPANSFCTLKGKPCAYDAAVEGDELFVYPRIAGDGVGDAIDSVNKYFGAVGRTAERITSRTLDFMHDNPLLSLGLVTFFGPSLLVYGIAATFLAPLFEGAASSAGGSIDKTITTRPDIAGAQNQNAAGSPIPIILGRHRITPQIIGQYWTEATTGDDGEDMYLHGLLSVGFSPLKITQIKMGDMLLSANGLGSALEGTLTLNNTSSTWLSEDDEVILQIKQSAGAMNSTIYDKKVVEEQLGLDIKWAPMDKSDPPYPIDFPTYLASAPVRMSSPGVQYVGVTIAAQGWIWYKDNEKKTPDPLTFTLLWRPVGGSSAIYDASTNPTGWRQCTGGQSALTIPSGIYEKEIRYNLVGSFHTFNPDAADAEDHQIEYTVVRSRANKVDEGKWSYVDDWTWVSGRTITVLDPCTEAMQDKICRIAFRIKATERMSGNLGQINMIAESILPTYNTETDRWDLEEQYGTEARWSRWATTQNPADFLLASLLGRWFAAPAMDIIAAQDASPQTLLDWDALKDIWRWCNESRDVELNDGSHVTLAKQITFNKVVSSRVRLDQFHNMLLETARAVMIPRGSKFAFFHDTTYSGYPDSAQYKDPFHLLSISGLLDPQNSSGFTVTRGYTKLPDAVTFTFISEAADYFKEETVTYRNPYLTEAEYDARVDAGTAVTEKVSPQGMTSAYQIQAYAAYWYAKANLRRTAVSVTVPDTTLYTIGARIAVSHDVIKKGLLQGRIKDVSYGATSGNPTIITLDVPLTYTTTADLRLSIWHVYNGIASVRTITVLPYNGVAGQAEQLVAYIETPAMYLSPGDQYACGYGDTHKEDYVIIGRDRDPDYGGQLALVPYTPDVYVADRGIFRPYLAKISPSVQMIPTQSRPAASLIQATLGNISSLASSITTVQSGDPSEYPDDIVSVTAKAFQDYILVDWGWNATGLANNVDHFIVEISKNGGTSWTTLPAVTQSLAQYFFNRATDGYPEKENGSTPLNGWRVRVRAANIYGQVSLGYGPSVSGQGLDLTQYLTWIPPTPVVTAVAEEKGLAVSWSINRDAYYGTAKSFNVRMAGRAVKYNEQSLAFFSPFDRAIDGYPETVANGGTLDDMTVTVTAVTDEYPSGASDGSSIGTALGVDVSKYFTWIPAAPILASRASNRNALIAWDSPTQYYGTFVYHVQISKNGSTWFAPSGSLDPYASESNWCAVDSENQYAVSSSDSWSQGLPLDGQDSGLPVDTLYHYRVARYCTETTVSSAASEIAITATATSAKDVVAAAITEMALANDAVTADKIKAGEITADKMAVVELSAISANLGTISNGTFGASTTNFWDLDAGEFRVGDLNHYIHYDGDDFSMKLATLTVDAAGTSISGAASFENITVSGRITETNDYSGYVTKGKEVTFYGSNTQMSIDGLVAWLTANGYLTTRWRSSILRGSWYYAGNAIIINTGDSDYPMIPLAGSVVRVTGNTTAYTIEISCPTTAGFSTAPTDWVYVNNGSTYSPGWRRLLNTVSNITTTGSVYANRVTGVASSTSNDYHTGGLETRGNGSANTAYPIIGFHQPGLYASSIQLRGAADFRFYAQGAVSYASITAANITTSSNLTVGGETYLTGTEIQGDGKTMIRYSDSWLRINPDNDFSSGIYCNTGILRTDGNLQVGSAGTYFNANSSGISGQYLTSSSTAVMLGTGNSAGTNSVAIGNSATASGTNSVAIGSATTSASLNAVAVGVSASATYNSSTAIGYAARAGNTYALAVGYDAKADATGSIAIGQSARATLANEINIGNRIRYFEFGAAESQGTVYAMLSPRLSPTVGDRCSIMGSSNGNLDTISYLFRYSSSTIVIRDTSNNTQVTLVSGATTQIGYDLQICFIQYQDV